MASAKLSSSAPKRDCALSIDRLGARAHVAGRVGLQVAGRNRLFALEREAGHAFATRDAARLLDDGWRDVDRCGELEFVFGDAAMDCAGHGAVTLDELL